jgi:hypothetical protein
MLLQLGAIFLTSLLVGFSGALMPGPVFAVTVSESPRRGARTGPLRPDEPIVQDETVVGGTPENPGRLFRVRGHPRP